MTDALGRPQTILVLGGGSAIAQATLERLARRGLRSVVLAGRCAANMSGAAEPLRAHGVRVVTARFDAADIGTHQATIDAAFDEYGDFDLVIMAFGVLGDQERYEQNPTAAGKDAVVNYAGAISSGRAVASRLRTQGHGTLVVLSSVAGQRPRRANYVYGSAKAGLDAFARGLNETLRGSGARVMVVRPAFVRTRMTAHLSRPQFAQSPDEVAGAIVCGLDQNASIVWSPGWMRWVFLVLSAMPQRVFRRMRS
jgi:decaprenylphospho-beta-D-erythro-pentofuranosid-2-ulose 2-reductase